MVCIGLVLLLIPSCLFALPHLVPTKETASERFSQLENSLERRFSEYEGDDQDGKGLMEVIAMVLGVAAKHLEGRPGNLGVNWARRHDGLDEPDFDFVNSEPIGEGGDDGNFTTIPPERPPSAPF